MYFPAFDPESTSRLPPNVIYRIERYASMVITECDTGFLDLAMYDVVLPNALAWEVTFLGAVSYPDRDEVLRYFDDNAGYLYATAQKWLDNLDDEVVYKEINTPLRQLDTAGA